MYIHIKFNFVRHKIQVLQYNENLQTSLDTNSQKMTKQTIFTCKFEPEYFKKSLKKYSNNLYIYLQF